MRISLLFILLLVFTEARSQWTIVAPPANTLNLYSVFAIGDSAVAIAGDNKVSRSIDAGTTWTTPFTATGAIFYEVHSGEPTRWISLTANSTWILRLGNPSGTYAASPKPDSILSLHFYTGACGIAVGYAGKIEATCDTGNTWQLRYSNTLFNLRAIWFADAAIGCACGDFGSITCTQNSGATWATVSSTVSMTLNAIHFPTPTIGYIAGNAGTFLKSTDAGATWNSIPSGVPNNLNGVFFVDADTGYVAGSGGLIMKTTDGGTSWTPMISNTTQTLNSIHFSSPTVGWVVGNNATILKFNDFPTGITEDNSVAGVLVYPNPASSQFTIYDLRFTILNVEVSDVTGRIVFDQQTMDSKQQNINVAGWNAGIYFVRVKTEEGTVTRKIIVQ